MPNRFRRERDFDPARKPTVRDVLELLRVHDADRVTQESAVRRAAQSGLLFSPELQVMREAGWPLDDAGEARQAAGRSGAPSPALESPRSAAIRPPRSA